MVRCVRPLGRAPRLDLPGRIASLIALLQMVTVALRRRAPGLLPA
ncbi:hypothetical protein [Streptomyces phaeoluteigriseus]|nr:hypothetical protein [Streptomyces phaeoluteigriseus]